MNTANNPPAMSTIITNREARRNYAILETIETGIALRGTEVKSLRDHRGNVSDAFARIERGEVILYNLHISPYDKGNRFNHDPLRPRKLLLHKNEILRLAAHTERKGRALIPLRLYFKRGHVKVELAVGQGKMEYDKREDIKKREHTREMTRAKAQVAAKARARAAAR
jgi:SsrA-binding protein